MARVKAASIDAYISGFPEEVQEKLQQMRAIIKKAAPRAEETISYAIPAFNLDKRYLVYFAGHTKHIGLYPAPTTNKEFKKDFEPYKTSKGTVQFPYDKPLPVRLITKIVKYKIKENKEREALKKK